MSMLFSFTATGLDSVIGQYEKTVEIPCNIGDIKAEDISIAKWKYVSHGGGH